MLLGFIKPRELVSEFSYFISRNDDEDDGDNDGDSDDDGGHMATTSFVHQMQKIFGETMNSSIIAVFV